MVISKTNFASKVLKYTKNGATLVSKRPIAAEELSELTSIFKLPSNITSAQCTRVGQGFNATKNYTDTISFFDNNKNLIIRIQDIYKDSINLSTKVKQFNYPKVWEWDKYNKLIEKTEVNLHGGKVTQKTNMFQQIYKKNGVNTVAIGKVAKFAGNGKVNQELQSALKYSNKGPKIGYQLQFDNLSNGEKNIAGMKTWGGVKVNPKDPYLSTYLYPRDDFAKSAYTHALKRYGINSQELAPRLDANSQILLQSGSRGRYVPS